MKGCSWCTVVIMLATIPSAATAQEIVRDSAGVFAADHVEILFDGGFFTEGPAMGPDGLLYFSDITFTDGSGMQAGILWRLDPATPEAEIYRSPSGMSNGLLFDLDGNLVAALGADFGGRAVVRTDRSTGRSVIIAGLVDGKRLNSPNDLTIDEAGRIYFTDPRYSGHEPMDQPVMGVYRIDVDGAVTRVINDAGRPNGILVSPDQRTLYVASIESTWSGLNALLAYDLDADGNVSNQRIVRDFRPEPGPDGMAVDVLGRIYAARPASDPGVYVYSPDGEELAFVRIPGQPTNAAFGVGRYATTLFITASESVYSVEASTAGYHASRP
ncbi:MAG: SMP-30/gluconolactonase/LRE family protein [Gemmatimonadota bacterium]|nr:MAG: SMP-30/gluconolactonase/LRE family protein [Gemmatimonadota bacterium]